MPLAKDLLHPLPAEEKRKHKLLSLCFLFTSTREKTKCLWLKICCIRSQQKKRGSTSSRGLSSIQTATLWTSSVLAAIGLPLSSATPRQSSCVLDVPQSSASQLEAEPG